MPAITPRSPGRRPVDPTARERLREAQAAEASAVAHFFTASDRVTAATAALSEAERRLAQAADAMIAVSGTSRAMLVLGLDKPALRAITAARPPS